MKATSRQSAVQSAAERLRKLLSGGPVPATEAEGELLRAGHSRASIRRARQRLGVIPYRLSIPGAWLWRLPGEEQPQGAQDAASPCWPADIPPPAWWGEFLSIKDSITILATRKQQCSGCSFPVVVEWEAPGYPRQWSCPRCGKAANAETYAHKLADRYTQARWNVGC